MLNFRNTLGKKFSKDSKSILVSIDKFLEDYLSLATYYPINLFDENARPKCGSYFKVTSKYLILVSYRRTRTNYGMDVSEILSDFSVAYRDGKTEYELIDFKLKNLLSENENIANVENIEAQIQSLQTIKKSLNETKYNENFSIKHKKFEDCIINVDYKTSIDSLFGKYIVFDVETNGLRTANDDLISISIYDPSTGKGYNRYLPLDLQPLVLTGWIHGITTEQLENEEHITQEELDKLIEFFDLKNKILLSYSGGKGTFDYSFIINYCKRHKLFGFENLHYENIKELCPDVSYVFAGQLSKDNLCELFKITGIQKIHSSLTDCILEWKLFEKLKNQQLFFIDQDLYKYHNGYIVPITYLNRTPELKEYANISIPYLEGKLTCIFDYSLPKNVVSLVKKFPTNITGISLENVIFSALNVEKLDNVPFLIKNKSHLEYMGSLQTDIQSIPVEVKKDGTLKALDPNQNDYINEVNEVSNVIIRAMTPVLEFIRHNIFKSKKIYNQELVISADGKILALCDLSNEETILEIKTFNVALTDITNSELIDSSLARQLYYESRGRNIFILSLDFNSRFIGFVDAVNIKIYSVDLKQTTPKPIEKIKTLNNKELNVLNLIIENPYRTNISISRKLNLPPNTVGDIIKDLKMFGYIIKENENKRSSYWIILRTPKDDKTRYLYFNGIVTPLFDKTEGLKN